MTGIRRFLVKGAAALLVGVPFTLIPAFFLAWGLFAGLEGLFAPPKVRAVQAGALTLMWSLAGILGILGFWAWVFLARNARRKVRNLIAVTLAAGLASLLSAGVPPEGVEGWLFLAGGLAALGVPMLLLLKPHLSWNPDRPDPA